MMGSTKGCVAYCCRESQKDLSTIAVSSFHTKNEKKKKKSIKVGGSAPQAQLNTYKIDAKRDLEFAELRLKHQDYKTHI